MMPIIILSLLTTIGSPATTQKQFPVTIATPRIASSPRSSSPSTRGQVGTGDNILIGGLIVGGSTPKPLVIRALGQTLTQFGVTGVLADPYLELRDGNGNLVEANNDWQQSPEAAITTADGKAPSNTKQP